MRPDQRLARIAAEQFGIITRAQALDCGLTPGQIRYRITTGKWSEILPGIYRVAGAPESWHQLLFAAQKWAGPSSAVSGRSAAVLWELNGFARDTIEVTTTRRMPAPCSWLTLHIASLTPGDTRTREGIVVTSPERTLFDLAARSSTATIESAIDEAVARGLTTIDRLVDFTKEYRRCGRPGSRTMGEALDEMAGEAPSAGKFERKLFRVLQEHGVRAPVRQHPVTVEGQRFYLDFAYPDALLGVEAHSRKHHRDNLDDWERDQARHGALSRAGWTILYITWRRLRDHPASVARDVASTLRTRSLQLARE